jgi:hypothetical protein
MNLERVVERLRDYRLKNERFDRLVGVVLSNEKAMRAARATIAASRSVSRRGQTVAAGDYDTVFFVAGEMRSGTSWLRHSLSDHPEIACGQEGSFFGRGYDREEIPVYTGPVSSLTRALALSRDLKTWHALPWNLWSDGYDEDLRNLSRLSVDYFLSKEVARTGRRIVGDKSPQHTENLDEIHEIYPDARIIHIVRDGRDVAVSAMHHWWRLAKDREGGVFDLAPEELRIRDDYAEDRERQPRWENPLRREIPGGQVRRPSSRHALCLRGDTRVPRGRQRGSRHRALPAVEQLRADFQPQAGRGGFRLILQEGCGRRLEGSLHGTRSRAVQRSGRGAIGGVRVRDVV